MSGDPLDMTGFWHGTYAYPNFQGPTTPFVATISEVAGSLSGSIIEPNMIGHSSEELQAVMQGMRQGRAVDFTKTYDGASDAAHAVDYVGQLSSDGNTITGVWSLEAWDGTFEMHRDAVLEEEIEAEESLEIEVERPQDAG